MDNAPVDLGNSSFQVISACLDALQIFPVFLPTYSPELNACELVFNKMKTYLKNHSSNDPITEQIVRALSKVTVTDIIKMYKHCIFPNEILPELTI
jgi:transposase